MKFTPRAQATLRTLIICRQNQLDARLATSTGSARRMLEGETADLMSLWAEAEALENDDEPDSASTAKPSPGLKVTETRRKAGRPKKAVVEVAQ